MNLLHEIPNIYLVYHLDLKQSGVGSQINVLLDQRRFIRGTEIKIPRY
jgi:hypothetical protein